MIICKKCGTNNKVNSKFCKKCGNKLLLRIRHKTSLTEKKTGLGAIIASLIYFLFVTIIISSSFQSNPISAIIQFFMFIFIFGIYTNLNNFRVKLHNMSFIKKLPGFRSGNKWKMIIAMIIYSFILMAILASL